METGCKKDESDLHLTPLMFPRVAGVGEPWETGQPWDTLMPSDVSGLVAARSHSGDRNAIPFFHSWRSVDERVICSIAFSELGRRS